MLMNVSRPSLHRELRKLEEAGIIAYVPPMITIIAQMHCRMCSVNNKLPATGLFPRSRERDHLISFLPDSKSP